MPTTNSPAKPTPYAASDSPLTGSVTTLASVALSTGLFAPSVYPAIPANPTTVAAAP
jgi:hypothetical protein